VSLGAGRPVIQTEGTNSGQPGRYQAALRAGYSCSAVALNLDRSRQRSGSMEHRDRGVVARNRLEAEPLLQPRRRIVVDGAETYAGDDLDQLGSGCGANTLPLHSRFTAILGSGVSSSTEPYPLDCHPDAAVPKRRQFSLLQPRRRNRCRRRHGLRIRLRSEQPQVPRERIVGTACDRAKRTAPRRACRR